MNHKPGSVIMNAICLEEPFPDLSGSLPAFSQRAVGGKDVLTAALDLEV